MPVRSIPAMMKLTATVQRMPLIQPFTYSSVLGLFLCWGGQAMADETLPIRAAEQASETYRFAGQCPNGAPYRLFFYEAKIEGVVQSFYDFEGPAGRGTVKTNAPPKTMAVRVCRALSEIASDQL